MYICQQGAAIICISSNASLFAMTLACCYVTHLEWNFHTEKQKNHRCEELATRDLLITSNFPTCYNTEIYFVRTANCMGCVDASLRLNITTVPVSANDGTQRRRHH